MGLYTYPVLMAADILLFDSHIVPVGRDQTQQVEMAHDIAQAVNFNYKAELLRPPEASIQEHVAVVPGLDGRKMSKSYGNTIPLFAAEKELRKLVMRIVTNSQPVEEPKDPDASQIYLLYKLFAAPEERQALADRYRAGGMGWGEAKQELFRVMNRELTPLRERFNAIIADIPALDALLARGAEKARDIAKATIARLRGAIGID
jgi:tryptophanyl-tRNA synthetase